jgi:uroporphyrinogen-III decarboxylase
MLPGIGLDHGFHLLRLEYLRGFENLMFDLLEEPEEFKTLVEKVHAFNKELVRRYIELGAPVISLPEDLGSTQGTIVGPGLIEKWVMPYYRELHDMAHAAGRFTNFHCDGNIMNIAGQILDLKPDVFNPQDRLNGIDNLAAAFKGRLCVKLDFDRGLLSSPSSTAEIAELVEEEVRKLGDRNGGLMLFAEVRGAVPLENVEALAAAMEKYSRHWFE